MSEIDASDEIQSPCIGICRLNDDGVCTGCFRTGQEIRAWREGSNEVRLNILESAAARRK